MATGQTVGTLATAALFDAWMASDTYSALHKLVQGPEQGAPPVPAYDDPAGGVGWPCDDCHEFGPCACFFVDD